MLNPNMLNPNAILEKKIKIPNWMAWGHHRSGWKYVLSGMQRLHNKEGIWCHPFLDGHFRQHSIQFPWIGFLHNPPYHPWYLTEVDPLGLSKLVNTKQWKQSCPYCLGIFTVSQHAASFLSQHLTVPISALKHPIEFPNITFSYEKFIANKEKILLMTGHWMRRYESFYRLKADGYCKKFLTCKFVKLEDLINRLGRFCLELKSPQFIVGQVTLVDYVSNETYDLLHEQNIVFLDLYDVAACNTILDCIVRNTPLLIRKLPGAIDYLGEDYPFYYETLSEAEEKLQDFNLILRTHQYLQNMNKADLKLEHFINKMIRSKVYSSLPEV
jgi:hypothetical protein